VDKAEKTAIAPEKLAKILEVAQKRFARYGLGKTTMSEIADDLGISKAALYYYFPDKECIFKKVLLKEQNDFCQQMKNILASDLKIKEALKQYIENRISFFGTLINLSHINYDAFQAQKPLYSSLGKEFYEREKEIIKAILQNAHKKNEIKKVDIDEYAGFFAHVLRTLRLYTLGRRELWDQGLMEKELKHEYTFFTNIFLKSIEKV
jgi:TetR/AcrR family transcriptional repressor of mexJK operon